MLFPRISRDLELAIANGLWTNKRKPTDIFKHLVTFDHFLHYPNFSCGSLKYETLEVGDSELKIMIEFEGSLGKQQFFDFDLEAKVVEGKVFNVDNQGISSRLPEVFKIESGNFVGFSTDGSCKIIATLKLQNNE